MMIIFVIIVIMKQFRYNENIIKQKYNETYNVVFDLKINFFDVLTKI